MKRAISILLLVFAVFVALAQQQALKVSDVIDMAHASLPDELIIAKLRKANQSFDLTTQQMVDLKKAGVSDNVIKAMMDPSAAATPRVMVAPGVGMAGGRASGATPGVGTSEAAIEANMNNPDAPHDSGVYIYTTNREYKKILIGLERAAYQGTKSNFLGHAVSGGLMKAKSRAIIPGPHASIRVTDPRPEFYFYFEDKSAALGKNGFGGQSVSNPNQFALVKLEAKKDNRETVVGTIGFGSMDFGTDPKAMIAFKAEKLRPGAYRVVPTANMEPGEYAFIGGSAAPAGMAGAAAAMDIFDFAILSGN